MVSVVIGVSLSSKQIEVKAAFLCRGLGYVLEHFQQTRTAVLRAEMRKSK
jgi:hypothetical protein